MPAVVVPKLAAVTKVSDTIAYVGPPTTRSHSVGSDDLRTSEPASPIRLSKGTGAAMPSITGSTMVLPLGAMRIIAPI